MRAHLLLTERLESRPLPSHAAAALLVDRSKASRVLNAPLSDEWPQPDLLRILPRQAAASADEECFGIWVMIERSTGLVVGDIGFHGPPDDAGVIEIGFSVVPSCRRRGYATEAARSIVKWAIDQETVDVIVAGCEPSNVASAGTLEKAGFCRTGTTNGELRWRFGR